MKVSRFTSPRSGQVLSGEGGRGLKNLSPKAAECVCQVVTGVIYGFNNLFYDGTEYSTKLEHDRGPRGQVCSFFTV